jgi:hypothetical protein
MAARTEQQILDSFKESARQSDATVDVDKGPLYDLIGRPLSKTIEPLEVEVDRLNKIYSVEFALSATEEEGQAFLDNWGESAGLGTPSTVRIFFMTFNRPRTDQVITIAQGSLVGNFDQSLQYITLQQAEIRGDQADLFYNPSRRSYEIDVLCQAVAIGAQYALPAGRIISQVTRVEGIDAVENREAASQGEAAETLEQQILRVQEKFFGLAINTGNGSFTRIKRLAPTTILDVKTILSSDRELFKRIAYGPAKDYYVLSNQVATVPETYTAVGGETEIPIQTVPALSVSSVSVNSVAIANFTVRLDRSDETGGSARAQDKLVLAFPLLANDVVRYSVTYDSTVRFVQDSLDEVYLFNTDELTRRFKRIPIRIELTGRCLATYDPVQIETQVRSVIEAELTQNVWVENFFPNDILDSIKKQVLGITNIKLERFQRSTGFTSPVEVVSMKKTEIATYDSSFVSVLIRTV